MALFSFQPSTQLLYLLPVLAFALYVAYQHFFSPLAGMPGPFGASFSPMLVVKHAWQGKSECSAGNTYQLTPNDVDRCMVNSHNLSCTLTSNFRSPKQLYGKHVGIFRLINRPIGWNGQWSHLLTGFLSLKEGLNVTT